MWGLYLFMALLSASIVVKLARPLLHPGPGVAVADRRRRAQALSVIILLPLLALVLYQLTGRPDLRGAQAIFTGYNTMAERHNAALAQRPMMRLLNEDGEDVGALVSMAQINYRLAKYEAALPYLARAWDVAARDDDWRLRHIIIMLGETMVLRDDGRVGDDTREVFEEVLALHAENPLARHYLALYKAQHGDRAGAIAEWNVLLSEGPVGAYWKKRVRDGIAEAREDLRLGKGD